MPKAIIVENLSKAYQLGDFGTGTISRDVERFIAKVRGKEDPYLRIGETNDRTTKGESDMVWVLKDLNFDIAQGDAVGIIGRNGAGKSTLLKVLSRITSPTQGSIKVKGRIASLLEVGTGFHPELTGRENIYLNGAILGMRKTEIKRRFDEIVAFSGVERYIDTPVKRYSSGMYVRLAFAVAAHLESEILIVDEVLAVGDAEFQKKCLGKMGDISKGEGRTVLFVSHNMGAIKNLCSKAILLKNGVIIKNDLTDKVIESYIESTQNTSLQNISRRGNRQIEISDFHLLNEQDNEQNEFFMGDDVVIKFQLKFNQKVNNAEVGINVKNIYDEIITHITNFDNNINIFGEPDEAYVYKITLKNLFFSPGNYNIDIAAVAGEEQFDVLENCLSFNMIEGDKIKRGSFPKHVRVYTPSIWQKSH